jgi:biopolymer transport protein ExbB
MSQTIASNGWMESLAHADPIALAVLYLLVGLSLLAWFLIIYKTWELVQAGRTNRAFAKQFWETDLSTLKEKEEAFDSGAPFAQMTARGLAALEHYYKYHDGPPEMKSNLAETLTRVLRQSIQDCVTRFETGIGLLATIGNTAPFIGLFGTVVGIMSALTGISRSGAAGLDVVAGPIGEALIATAAGLACAIPAVVGYNAFVRRLRVMGNTLDGFAHDLLVRLVAHAAERRLEHVGRN